MVYVYGHIGMNKYVTLAAWGSTLDVKRQILTSKVEPRAVFSKV